MADSYRKTYIKISFANEYARPKAHEIEPFIRDEVKIDPNHVVGIHLSIVSSVVYVKLINEAVCDGVVQAHKQGLKFRHSDGHIGDVTIDRSGLGLRTIRVFELPFEVPSDVVIAALQPYGRVLSHVAEKWQTFTTYPVLNGVRQIKIELTKHVPSYLVIGGCRAIIIYDGQPKTCSGCGKEGHVRSECMQRRLVQVPVGEAVAPTTPTTLPITYVEALRMEADQPLVMPSLGDRLQEISTPVAETPAMTTYMPPPIAPSAPPPVEEVTEGRMEVDSLVVPTAAFVPERRGSLSDQDKESNTHTQRSPKRRKKRHLAQSNTNMTCSEGDDNDRSGGGEHLHLPVESNPHSGQAHDADHLIPQETATSSADPPTGRLSSLHAKTLPLDCAAGEARREPVLSYGSWADDCQEDKPIDTAEATAAAASTKC